VAGAKHGVETMRYAIEHMGIDVDFAPVFELLTQFGAILQIDVPDMLNRNAFRAEALEEYTFTLGEFIEEAKREKAQLEVQKEEASDERRERRKEVTSLEKEARTAEREKNFAHVGEVQQALVGAKASAAEAEAKAEQISSLINAMEDLLEVAEERKTAIEQNREVLIAGLHIVEVPGIEDLQIINEKQRKSFSFGKSQQ
jgi:chromosome segregation ATPase